MNCGVIEKEKERGTKGGKDETSEEKRRLACSQDREGHNRDRFRRVSRERGAVRLP